MRLSLDLAADCWKEPVNGSLTVDISVDSGPFLAIFKLSMLGSHSNPFKLAMVLEWLTFDSIS